MSYSNSYKLKVESNETEIVSVCENCDNKREYKDANFCPECGSILSEKEIPINYEKIIAEFREFSDEAAYLIDDEGDTNESGSGYGITDDLQRFSKKYPNVLFVLRIDWDGGFMDPPTKYYVKNGKKATYNATYTFPEFDETQLK